jgi:hypothetical protein
MAARLSALRAGRDLLPREKIQAIYFSYRIKPPDTLLTLNGHNIPFVNSIKYLGVIFDKKITWRLHIEMVTTKAYITFMRLYSLLKSP